MAVAAEIQIGTGVKFGIGSFTFTGAATFNAASAEYTHAAKFDRIASQNGAVIETIIASQRSRKGTFKFVPKGATRAAAITVIGTLLGTNELDTITIAASDVTIFNVTWNYLGGAKLMQTREGYAVCDIEVETFETAATAGTYAALATIVG